MTDHQVLDVSITVIIMFLSILPSSPLQFKVTSSPLSALSRYDLKQHAWAGFSVDVEMLLQRTSLKQLTNERSR